MVLLQGFYICKTKPPQHLQLVLLNASASFIANNASHLEALAGFEPATSQPRGNALPVEAQGTPKA